MLDEGFIKINRKIQRKGFWKNSCYVHLWIHLLLRANWQETEVLWNGKIITLQAGQFITGRHALASETGISASTVERALNVFETEQQIEQQKTNRFRLIIVKNWCKYQDMRTASGQQTDSQRTTNGQPADTVKESKKARKQEYKDREAIASTPETETVSGIQSFEAPRGSVSLAPRDETRAFFEAPIPDTLVAYFVAKGFPESVARSELAGFVNYWTERNKSGTKQKWELQQTFEIKRRLRTWMQNCQKFNPQFQQKKGTFHTLVENPEQDNDPNFNPITA